MKFGMNLLLWSGDMTDDLLPVLEQLPDGIHWDVSESQGLQFQAATQEKVQELRALFPGVVWKRTWGEKGGTCKWWEYTCTYQGLKVEIYACRENPPQCRARYEVRVVEKQIADTFHTETVEEKVLVGWDCGDPKNLTMEGADDGK